MENEESAEVRQQRAGTASLEENNAGTSALVTFKVAAAAEAAAKRMEAMELRRTLQKLRSKIKIRDRAAIERAGESLALRYAADSGLRQIDVKSFTVLVERVNIRTLRHFRDRGVPQAILGATQEMPLPEPFWVEYHTRTRISGNKQLSKLYFMGILHVHIMSFGSLLRMNKKSPTIFIHRFRLTSVSKMCYIPSHTRTKANYTDISRPRSSKGWKVYPRGGGIKQPPASELMSCQRGLTSR